MKSIMAMDSGLFIPSYKKTWLIDCCSYMLLAKWLISSAILSTGGVTSCGPGPSTMKYLQLRQWSLECKPLVADKGKSLTSGHMSEQDWAPCSEDEKR